MASFTQFFLPLALRICQHRKIEVCWELVLLFFLFFSLLFPMNDFPQTQELFPSMEDLVRRSRIQIGRHLLIPNIIWACLSPSSGKYSECLSSRWGHLWMKRVWKERHSRLVLRAVQSHWDKMGGTKTIFWECTHCKSSCSQDIQ